MDSHPSQGIGPTERTRLATFEDLEEFPEDAHVEVIDGEVVFKSAPDAPHGLAHMNLPVVLNAFDGSRRPNGLGGWIFLGDTRTRFEPHQIFQPDVAGWRKERLPTLPPSGPIELVPDWVCEILSTNDSHDLNTKLRVYHQRGVAHYWIIDPSRQLLTVYRHSEAGYVNILTASRKERVRAEPFAAIEWSLGFLFGEDSPETVVLPSVL
jgi:Uma2 family endonuclease